jgi:uncharacterized protein (TIGR01777 family)
MGMKIVIPGGSGQVGALLAVHWQKAGHDVVVLTRNGRSPARTVLWDGRSIGPWAAEIDGADVVVNLAGRSVSCRYTASNLQEMMQSRIDSTRVVGEAIAQAARPPRLWLQMSTATIYAHRFDAANDEATGIIGGNEAGVPAYWKRSIDIATAWEKTLQAAATPQTRRVALRASMIMADEAEVAATDNILSVLVRLTRLGLGGAVAGGRQYVSWVHGDDFCAALDFLIAHDELDGAVNIAAPHPLPHREFMAALRAALGVRLGLPATSWMVKIGALFMNSDPELLLKSRRVVPRRLLEHGFVFQHPRWHDAVSDLVQRRTPRGLLST